MSATLLAVLSLLFTACGSNEPIEKVGSGEEEESVTPAPTKEAEDPIPVKEDPAAAPTPEEADPEEPDFLEIYAPILQENLDLILFGYDPDKRYMYMSTGLMECVMYEDREDLLDQVGYVIEDISGDGIPELMIGRNIIYETDEDESATIYAVHTLGEEKTELAFEGWYRNSYHWLGGGKFYRYGSDGAMNSSFGQCHLSEDGRDLIWDEYYFSYEKNGAPAYYSNNSGISDPDSSEELDIAPEDFWKRSEEYELKKLSFTSMREFEDLALSMDPDSLLTEEEQSILGSWSLRSYVNMNVIGYKMFYDGTWLAIENPSVLYTDSLMRSSSLSGTWKATNGGVDFYGFDLFFEDRSDSVYAMVYVDEDGNEVLSIDDMEYYHYESTLAEEVEGTWLFPRGTAIAFDEAGDWEFLDEDGNVVFCGHSVIENGPNGIYLRLHTQAFDTGNIRFADGILHTDAAGYDTLDMEFDPLFSEFSGTEASLSRGL